jgi:threonine synthase
MPEAWPLVAPGVQDATLVDAARAISTRLAEGDSLAPHVDAVCREALDIAAPIVPLTDDGRLSVLELFHGPTAAFKDFGARFLAACLSRLPRSRPLDIMVATSGDTGGAVAAAFHQRPGVRVTLLFPEGRVSPLQERQLTCWGGNVTSLAVRGSFDDCQRLVKALFADPSTSRDRDLSTANSINIGRLLPQAAYYAAAALATQREHGEPLSFIVPSGNLGNAFGAMAARLMGFPVGRIVLAHNANRAVPDYLATGRWAPRPSVTTLATAMDVGNPSNMERFRALFSDAASLSRLVDALSVDDLAIRARIVADAERWGRVWCPHTAVAAEAWARMDAAQQRERWCLVATAHPAKFSEVVEPLIGRAIDVPESLRGLYARPTSVSTIEPTLEALVAAMPPAA